MGWKASAIIINNPKRAANEQLLLELGFNNLKKIEDEPVEVALDPGDGKVYIGTYKDNVLICEANLPMQFFEDDSTAAELKIKQLFPTSEICAIILHSGVNLWGFSVTITGQKIRARAGSSDDGTFIEYGKPLEEEKELLGKSKIDNDGNRIYILEDFPDETFSEDQVGENFVFSICKRYFGEELDSADELLFDTNLAGYTFSRFSLEDTSNQTPTKPGGTKPWWKLW